MAVTVLLLFVEQETYPRCSYVRSPAIVAVLSLLFVGFPLCAGQDSLEGDWVGEFSILKKSTFVQAHFKIEKNSTRGTIDFPTEGAMGIALEEKSAT